VLPTQRGDTRTVRLERPSTAVPAAANGAAGVPTSRVSVTVNGQPQTLQLDNRTMLRDALREHLRVTGNKKSCDHGQCGTCTVIVDDHRFNSCLTLAVSAWTDANTCSGLSVQARSRHWWTTGFGHREYAFVPLSRPSA
jgi:aerobic-type carbon monoxide dehydrogenase small subunit (CoxS/CutS family)